LPETKQETTAKTSGLSREKREEIFTIIRGRIGPDDRLPEHVIRDDFNGDQDGYLRIMASLYGVAV
jgi:hypothetical protein